MRVSENTSFNRAIEYVRKSKEKVEKSQEKVGLLRRINKPSDDPLGMVRLLKLRGEKTKIQELGKNIDAARTFMEISDGALSQIGEMLIRSKELALQQAGDVGTSPITRRTVAEEVDQMQKQLMKIANTQYAGRYIFSGFKTDTPPFDLKGEYYGDMGEIDIEVANEVFLPINIPGNIIFLGENRVDGGDAVDLFKTFRDLKIGLLTNDSKTIQNTLEEFDKCIDQNVLYRARIGSRVNSLNQIKETHMKKDMDMMELISEVEDADVYKEFSELKKNENVLKTTLASSAKVIQPSLMDFLR